MEQGLFERFTAKIDEVLADFPTIRGFAGFDGFVDEIIDVVDTREDAVTYQRFDTITQYAERLLASAGKSANIELVSKQSKIGGNGPIMANSMLSLGMKMSYVGSLGDGKIESVFKAFEEKAEALYTITKPAHTDALEFNDGKIMVGKLESLKDINWDNIIKVLGDKTVNKLLSEADCIATVNWTMLSYMNGIWQGLVDKAEELNLPRHAYIFIDLADPSKRTDEDQREALELIQKLNKHFKVVLGLNLKEAQILSKLYGHTGECEKVVEQVQDLASFLREKLELDYICVHPREFAVSCTADSAAVGQGPFTDNPKISTGAGDHFNAGYFTGVLLGFDQELALHLGCLNSGYYVRTAVSPTLSQIRELAVAWKNGDPETIRS